MSTALEEIKTIDIEQWLTLNTAASSTKLKQGETPNSKNVWVDEKPGSVITAPGLIKVGSIPSGLPPTFCINYFKTSAGTQTFVVSDNSTVWTTGDFQNFTSIITGLSSAFQLRGKVIRDKLWLTNGSDAVRVYDGTTVTVLDGSGGTPTVPKGRYIDYHDERVWLYHIPSARSQVAFSALTDASANIIAPDNANAWPSSNTIQISEGDADFGTGLIIYRGYLHFFKQYSIWRLVGYDEYTYSRVKTRSSTGTRFNESVQILDSLVHLIGVDGIYIFDGEESERISDIIDPATASQTAFGFNQLQQPNVNNQFWEVTDTSDWNLGTPSRNLSVDNELLLIAADSAQSDFQAGTILTNIDTTSVEGIQLSTQASAGSKQRIGQGINAYLDDGNNGAIGYGSQSFLTDGDVTRQTGLGIRAASSNRFVVDLSGDQATHYNIGRVILRAVEGDTSLVATVQVNTGTYQTKYGNQGTWVTVGTFNWMQGTPWNPTDFTFDFVVQNAIQVSVFFSAGGGSYQMAEIEVYTPRFQTSGEFASRTLNLGITPTAALQNGLTFGDIGIVRTGDGGVGGSLTIYTRTSDDGTTWDPWAATTPLSSIGTDFFYTINSTPRQYIQWRADFITDGSNSFVINAVYLPAIYLSAIHQITGGIFAWGPFESDYQLKGQNVNFYYRAATSSVGVSAASWNLIVPGGLVNVSVLSVYIQFKIEIILSTADDNPIITSVTINWIAGTGVQQSTLQNVASAYWRNRYWLAASGPGATSNDTVLVRGKKTFGSPWQLKDFSLLSFARFQDNLYAGSSIDGSIYMIDSGFSEAGSAIDSYFETGDFTFVGFTVNLIEVLIEVERMGSWNLAVGISIDGGKTWTEKFVDLSLSSFDSNYMKRLHFNITVTRFRIRFRTNGIDNPFQVHRCIAYYKMESERGSIKGDYTAS